jgi:inner membrane protein involved in colicin E2 resistance
MADILRSWGCSRLQDHAGGPLCTQVKLFPFDIQDKLTHATAENASYSLATAAVAGLIAGYCVMILRSRGRAVTVGASVAALYGALYVLLQNQDYSLLMGSVGLFVVLAVVMFLTRRIDWTASGSSP